ncbi:MAG: cation diffusion facilitator family transporter, partial [Phycisphaeraceae bacterium]
SAAVLSDALESVVNVAAGLMVVLSTWYAARPPDREHPYGHGKVEFVAVGIEGAMVVTAGALIVFESVRRMFVEVEVVQLGRGILMLAGINLLLASVAAFVWIMGRRLHSPTLVANGKHLSTDVLTTLGVIVGLGLVNLTGNLWLDPALALIVAAVILFAGWNLVTESWSGLTDRMDMEDDAAIRAILEAEIKAGQIIAYHKVRHRHTGAYHWVDMHLALPGDMTVREAHERVSRIEGRIERMLGHANATAHVEPPEAID